MKKKYMQQVLEQTRRNAHITILNCETVYAIVRKTRRQHEMFKELNTYVVQEKA